MALLAFRLFPDRRKTSVRTKKSIRLQLPLKFNHSEFRCCSSRSRRVNRKWQQQHRSAPTLPMRHRRLQSRIPAHLLFYSTNKFTDSFSTWHGQYDVKTSREKSKCNGSIGTDLQVRTIDWNLRISISIQKNDDLAVAFCLHSLLRYSQTRR